MSEEVNRRNIDSLVQNHETVLEELAAIKKAVAINESRIGTLINKLTAVEKGVQMAVVSKFGTGSTVTDNGNQS